MRRIFSILFAVTVLGASAQDSPSGDTTSLSVQRKPARERIADSLSILQQQKDNPVLNEENARNISNLVRLQEENRKKQKQAAMLRIAFGAAMAVVLVFGLMRRKKKK